MRATVEYHGIDADYPPIKVVIADGSDNEDVIIKVSDEGGGIPRSNMKRIWSYVSINDLPGVLVCSDLASHIISQLYLMPLRCIGTNSYSQLPIRKFKRAWWLLMRTWTTVLIRPWLAWDMACQLAEVTPDISAEICQL